MQGSIHSIETMGTVDGPGLRYVVFTAGCPLRCKYCHNPDTWDIKNGKQMTVDKVLDDYEKYRPYLKNGGITVSGGEPLVQLEFVESLFREAKNRNIHTCLDTSGATFTNVGKRHETFIKLAEVTDLVMLDIKHIRTDGYYDLVKGNLNETLDFLKFLSKKNIDVWVRHVIVKGYTYKKEYLYELGYLIGGFRNIKAIDVLPYHVMGASKYDAMGIDYPLEGMDPMPKENAIKARQVIEAGIAKRLQDDKQK